MHEVLLSQYVDGDFYEWHTDLGGLVTWNYFAFTEPKQFNGGEFCLSDALIDEKIIKNFKEIDPQNDRLVIFPAKYQHQVKQIQSQWTEPMANRYTVQVFFR
jgi:Rps23 Pro-64 3,4-dihydroxylase Tpa1-like proline 4-hydroxylase